MQFTNYSTDKPITSTDQDAFNRAGFAKRLSETILNKELEDGYVIGLYSEWGYGKTSTLNMIEQELSQDESVVFVKFNPWIFIDEQMMISGLFHTLADAIDANIETGTEKVGQALRKYSKALSPLKLDTVAEAGGALLSGATLDELRQRVETAISGSSKRLVVIIDDIDRLDKEELFQLFKLIKVAINFKQVVYLLAFDDKVVSEALGQRYLGAEKSGQSFLEKIVQVPIHLPLIEQQTLDTYVLSGLDKVLETYEVEISQEEVNRFREAFDEHIAGELRTPRMANRYLNSLKFVIPLTGGEINTVDILILEAVRLLYPEEYKELRLMKKDLSGAGMSAFMDKEEAAKLLKAKLEKITKDKPKLLNILVELFPTVKNAYHISGGGSYVNERDLQKLKRAASSDYFDRYFTYGIPKGDVSDLAILEVIEDRTKENTKQQLIKLIEERGAHAVIHKLRSYEDDIKEGENLALALSEVSEELPDNYTGLFRDSDLEAAAKLTVITIRNLANDNVELAKKVIASAANLDYLGYFIRWVYIECDDKKETPLFDAKDLAEVREVYAEHLLASNKTYKLYQHARLAYTHYDNLAEIKGRGETVKMLEVDISSFDDVTDFLTLYLSTMYGSGEPKRSDFNREAYKFMAKVIDPAYLYKILLAEDPSYAELTESPKFKPDTNVVGKEKASDFRKTVAGQFSYIHKKELEAPKEEEAQDGE